MIRENLFVKSNLSFLYCQYECQSNSIIKFIFFVNRQHQKLNPPSALTWYSPPFSPTERGVWSSPEERAGHGDAGDRAAPLIHPVGLPQHPAFGKDHGLHSGGYGRHAGWAEHLAAGEQRARTVLAAGAEVGLAHTQHTKSYVWLNMLFCQHG